MQTRRQFLRDCSLAATLAAVTPAALAESLTARPALVNLPGFEAFARQLKTTFIARSDSQIIGLVLVAAEKSAFDLDNSDIAGNENFSLIFRGPQQFPLEQNTYDFEHHRLGRLAMFIAPVGPAQPSYHEYQAIFSRPVNAAGFARQLDQAPRPRPSRNLNSQD